MIRGLMNFFVFAGSTLLLPVFGFMAWGWGSSDEKFLMKAKRRCHEPTMEESSSLAPLGADVI